jgi:diguanylate cyclase (GGDEF)-like protein
MPASDRKRLNVLMIEDNPGDCRLAEIALRGAAGDTHIEIDLDMVAYLAEGLDRLKQAHGSIDVVLLDLGLPDATGLDGLREVRRADPNMPIVVLTGLSDLGVATDALKNGAGDYLEKGEIQPGALLRSIRYAIERKKSEAELIRLARTDPLTGLLNRRAFFERTEDALAHARRSQLACAVIMFDLDRFKEVNDLFGHKTGDDLLVAVATRLRENLRSTDSCGRIGGDEFAILAPNLRSPNDAMEIAEKVVDLVGSITELDDVRVDLRISAGISVFPMDDSDAEGLLSHADMAMYKSKASKKGAVNFYDAGMDAAVKERRALKRKMRDDIEGNGFFLHYQPMVDAKTREMIGAEALARWRDSDNNIVLPDRFIPLAEESGVITPLGSRLLAEACSWLRQSAEKKQPFVPISFNVSTVECRDPGFALRFVSAIEGFRVPPDAINIEITETTIIQNLQVARDNLNLLKQYGVGIHMDDFGTGYSSLSLLRDLPLDALKIDRSFVRDIGKVAGSEPIVQTIVELCGKLGFKTIAEGVETKEQADFLREVGVTGLQGFYFSKPVTADQLTAMLSKRHMVA